MTTAPNPPLVVGIDGSEASLLALDWAATVAAARHWPLRLVHVYEPFVNGLPLAPTYEIVDPESIGGELLDEAGRRVAARWPDVATTVVCREGSTVPVLLDELGSGRLLVVGRRGMGRFLELLIGSTATACAGRAHGGVVVVPAARAGTEGTDGRVVVGVDGSAAGEAAVAVAFAEASARGRRLDVVHAWSRPSPYSVDFTKHGGQAGWLREQDLAVAEVVAGWGTKYPDVVVHTFVVEDHPASALSSHAAGADLLVIGGRGHRAGVDRVLGSVAQATIQHATSPVLVVHEEQPHPYR